MDTPHDQRLSVLVVDDIADAADSLALLLELHGHRVRTAYDGPSALEVAGANATDVVFIDLAMPGMDGWKLARLLREEAGANQPFVVALSGFAGPEYVRRSGEAGIDLHLVKPVEAEKLVDILGRVRLTRRGDA
jgi:CheY-like chemotaxis protein